MKKALGGEEGGYGGRVARWVWLGEGEWDAREKRGGLVQNLRERKC